MCTARAGHCRYVPAWGVGVARVHGTCVCNTLAEALPGKPAQISLVAPTGNRHAHQLDPCETKQRSTGSLFACKLERPHKGAPACGLCKVS